MDQEKSNANANATVQNSEVKLTDIQIKDENTALNIMVNFLAVAQKRGIFTFEESAKIWECIKVFQK